MFELEYYVSCLREALGLCIALYAKGDPLAFLLLQRVDSILEHRVEKQPSPVHLKCVACPIMNAGENLLYWTSSTILKNQSLKGKDAEKVRESTLLARQEFRRSIMEIRKQEGGDAGGE